MAYQRPNDLDGFIGQMGKADMRIRAQLAEDLVNYLSDSENSLACSDLGCLIDGLIPWLSGSHFKIAQRALEALVELINSLGQDFNAYTSSVLQHVVDRLGDSRDTVREKAQLVLNKLMECRVLAPQQLLDKLTPCFKHKNAKVREEFLQTIVNTLNEYGTQNLSVKTYIQPIVELLSDPTPSVRDAANQALVEVYKHVGDKLRQDLRKKNVPPNKLAVLEQKFDEVKSDNLLLPSAVTAAAAPLSNAYGSTDDPDACLMPRPNRVIMKRSPSARRPIVETMTATSISQNGSDANSAGAVSVAVFEMSFENVPKLTIFSQRDIDDNVKNIIKIIGDKSMDWEKRVDALKRIRSLLLFCPEMRVLFPQYSKDFSIAFLDILKELRSQVIREACITLAYMSKCLTTKLDSFLAYILSELVMLVANSAKVISSAGSITLKFVIKFSPSPKLIPVITQYLLTSKSKDIRSALCEVLGQMLEDWPTRMLEKSSPLIRDALKKSLADADMDARRYSRRSYWQFRRHFPAMADQMYNTLDLVTQKALEKERDNDDVDNGPDSGCMTASLRGSSSSLNSMPGAVRKMTTSGIRTPMASPSATSASTENLTAGGRLSRVPSLPRSSSRVRSSIPVSAVPEKSSHGSHRDLHLTRGPGGLGGGGAGGFRSISALDTAAVQRARARVQYSTLARQKVTSGSASLQGQAAQQARAKRSMFSPNSQASPEHVRSVSAVRTTARSAGVSQSQPTSRSTSPSSRQRDAYNSYGFRGTGTIPKKAASGIPRSLANSRETSPTRTSLTGLKRNSFSNGGSQQQPRRPPINPARPVLAQKMLLQSREAEQALSDALSPEDHDLSQDYGLRPHRKHRDESDESEASSVCSERSFDRTNDSFSWNGSRNRLDSFRAPITDIEVIIQYCASTHWAERRDGLTNLTLYLSEGKALSGNQLKCILELFRKMFLDSHTKVYALFLDTLNELILAHSDEMHDWLFILLVRLFSKLGTDLLVSMAAKIWKTLELVYEYFPPEVQLQVIFRILTDVVQTPNAKTRVATLKFLTKLVQCYCSPNQLSARQKDADKAVTKIVQFTQDKKVKELKDQACICLGALYNCNPPEMTQLFAGLQKSVQDAAKNVIQANMRKSPSSSPMSCASPKLLMSPQQTSSPMGPYGSGPTTNPGSPLAMNNNNHQSNNNNNNYHQMMMSSPRSRQSSMEDPMNSEEVYKSLRKTTAEIQNYSFESKLDRDATSKDSGISQMGGQGAGGGGAGGDINNGFSQYLEARVVQEMANGLGEMNLGSASSCNGGSSKATTESNTPENTVRGLEVTPSAGGGHNSSVVHSNAISYGADGQVIIENTVMEADVVREALALNADSNPEHVKAVLSNLAACVKFGNGEIPVKHFKGIMKMILNLFTSDNELMVKSAIYVLCKIIRSEPMRNSWMQFLELIILKIIDSYRISRDVSQRIDATIPQIAKNLPLDLTLNILYPVIATGEYPTNFAALKMLLELADKQGHLLTEQHLETIMPCLARLTDNACSLVRKEAVFCIVKLYVVMGEEMVKPKLSVLPPSKIRLLNVYINKSQNRSSTTTTSSAGANGGDPTAST